MVRLLLAPAAALLLVLSSCSLIGKDMFPDYLPYAESQRDVGADFDALGLAAPVDVQRVSLLKSPSSGRSFLFAFANSPSGNALFVYDSSTLALKKSYIDSAFSPCLAIAPTGNFLCGAAEIDASTLDIVGHPSLMIDPWAARAFYDELSGETWFFWNDGTTIHVLSYDASWNVGRNWGTSLSGAYPSASPVLDVEGGSGQSALRLLFSAGGSLLCLSFASSAVLDANVGIPMDTVSGVSAVKVSSSDSYQSWLTADGLLALDHSDNTSLVRHSFASGAKLDSYRVDSNDNGDLGFGFSQDGRRWYYLDKKKRTAYSLRTWW